MIESALLLDVPGIRHGFFTRQGGHSQGIYTSLNCSFGSKDDEAAVQRNRDVIATGMGVEEARLLTVWQSHSADAVVAQEPWDVRQPPKADAMVSNTPGLALGVLTADCTPVLFADRRGRAIGAAHAGWKGAIGGILEATVEALAAFGVSGEDLHAAIGPTIGRANYEVGADFRDRFAAESTTNERFFADSQRHGHYRFDLPGFVKARLERLGVTVEDLDLCTYADEARFFSYRRATHRGEPDYGRQISAIVLES